MYDSRAGVIDTVLVVALVVGDLLTTVGEHRTFGNHRTTRVRPRLLLRVLFVFKFNTMHDMIG